jgi:hypothetical protein
VRDLGISMGREGGHGLGGKFPAEITLHPWDDQGPPACVPLPPSAEIRS